MTELARDFVAEAARAHARNRQATARDHQRGRAEGVDVSAIEMKCRIFVAHTRHRATRLDAHAGRCAFVEQHAHDLLRRIVAEQLAEFLLVIGDAMALDQRDEIGRRVARQRRLAEMRIRRKEIRRRRAGVGEIAAAAAGHQDLLADPVGMLDHQHAPAAPTGRDRAHQAGGAAADDHRIERFRHALSGPACDGAMRTVGSIVTAVSLPTPNTCT